MEKPNPTNESTWTESRLQSECFKWHWNKYPLERGLLFTVDNNANDEVKGSVRKAMGRVSGVSDMIYLFNHNCYCFELKLPGKKQSPDQIKWEFTVKQQGISYCVVTSLDEFKRLIDQIHLYNQLLPF